MKNNNNKPTVMEALKCNVNNYSAWLVEVSGEYLQGVQEVTLPTGCLAWKAPKTYCQCTAPVVRTNISSGEYCGICEQDIEQ